jgi:hypothetical protein
MDSQIKNDITLSAPDFGKLHLRYTLIALTGLCKPQWSKLRQGGSTGSNNPSSAICFTLVAPACRRHRDVTAQRYAKGQQL